MARDYLTKLLGYKFQFVDFKDSSKHHKSKKKKKTKRPLTSSSTACSPAESHPPAKAAGSGIISSSNPLDTDSCPTDLSTASTSEAIKTPRARSESLPSHLDLIAPPAGLPIADWSVSPQRMDQLEPTPSTVATSGMQVETQLDLRVDLIPLTELRGRGDPQWSDLDNDSPTNVDNMVTSALENLCAFCDQVLPSNPSAKLIELGKYLKGRSDVLYRHHRTNRHALHLPFHVVADYCRKHNDETEVIPIGQAQGWPTDIDFSRLYTRVKGLCGHLWMITRREIPSGFFEDALRNWATLGRTKSQSVFYDITTFDVEQPGYYGPQGYEVLYRTLYPLYVGSSNSMTANLVHPLSPEYFLRKVLIPEAALALIAEDIQLSPDDPLVRHTLEESRKYGLAMFPDED